MLGLIGEIVIVWNGIVAEMGLCVTFMYISKMYASLWKHPEMSESMWSANVDGTMTGHCQTVGEHSIRPSE